MKKTFLLIAALAFTGLTGCAEETEVDVEPADDMTAEPGVDAGTDMMDDGMTTDSAMGGGTMMDSMGTGSGMTTDSASTGAMGAGTTSGTDAAGTTTPAAPAE
jgi:hypothetical protein